MSELKTWIIGGAIVLGIIVTVASVGQSGSTDEETPSNNSPTAPSGVSSSPSAQQASAAQISTPPVAINFASVIAGVAHSVRFSTVVPTLTVNSEDRGDEYVSITITYKTTAFPDVDPAAALQQTDDLKTAARSDIYIFMKEFIAALMKKGFDPTTHHTGIYVCAEQGGLKTMTGKPAVIPLGCEKYNPYTDSVAFEPPDSK
ncbi:hypothetical protein [Burkholderia gladioli]|uniref:hypothetical protein n=1 Tax=Burkholderia gladioli TaxID=28095 RepID=UPI00163FB469|nr:hypothetical protein [Burkholderia gladioli]